MPDKDYWRAARAKRIARLRAAGLCEDCGREPPEGASTRCGSCKARRSEIENARQKRKRAAKAAAAND